MNPGPCYKCKDRKMGCHGICDKYIKWKEKKDKQKEEKLKHLEFYNYQVNKLDKHYHKKGLEYRGRKLY